MEKCKVWVSVYETLKNLLKKLLNKILRYCTQNTPRVCVIKVCSNGGATLTWVCVIKVCSSGYNNNVKLYNNNTIRMSNR